MTKDYSEFYNLVGDNFNIDAVCPYYLPESQDTFTWKRDSDGVGIVFGYDPEKDDAIYWLCVCGNFERNCHCSVCGAESPQGCDCGEQDEDEYESDLDFGEFDPYPEYEAIFGDEE